LTINNYIRMMNKDQNPWTIINQKEIYENPWIKLTEFEVINPAGGKGIYGKVHFNNFAVGVIPLDAELNTWLVGQYRFPLGRYSWEIPEGGGNLLEDPIEEAKRELLEETGLVAGEWTEILNMHLSNSVTDEHAIIYLARKLEQREPSPEETEKLEVKKTSLDEAIRMVETGEITDSMSVAAILRVQLLIYQNKLKR
jgi:8-oxo-dGTP pyrophosphatase MutT (NUDIX family)